MPVTKNAIVAGWTGAFAKQVVFRQLHGKTVTSAYPNMRNRKLSEKQVKMNNLMRDANEYARKILRDEQQRNAAQIRLDVQRNKLYVSLVREYINIHKKEEKEVAINPEMVDKDSLFVNYLVETTNKTNEEIAMIAKVSVEFVEKVRGVRVG